MTAYPTPLPQSPLGRQPQVALTISGSDSGGGAGIQADLATFAAHGVHGTSALTAVTVQNTRGVRHIHLVPPDVVDAQVRAVVDDFPIAAVKTGMLGDATVVRAVADLAERGMLPNLVVDPVITATSGALLLSGNGADLVATRLLPHALVVTPNGDEAAALLGRPLLTSLAQHREAALRLREVGPRFVVVTGCRDGDDRVDVLVDETGAVSLLRAKAIATLNDHGTGCTFASAVAARLALGEHPLAAISGAKAFVRTALSAAAGWRLGAGAGPVSHLPPRWHTHSQGVTT